ncbi:TPA: hypothetical protein N0F65_007309 [Lagenidium giganteum]|uniref:PROP1-like PPR domain-containing protein n=1 Tax=Lagenidium giganteum TaxID=4803 RepID=A0AAV2Z6V8_9STRA|nr:TPA: hypothetical protein N0F65_007309 [Lagenidium giganteum]
MRSVLLKRVGGALLQATPRHVRVQTKRSWQPNIARQFGWKASGSSVRSFGTSTSAAVLETEPEPHAHEQQDSEKLLLLLEQSIQERQANKAYAYYKQLQSPLPALLTQKLAMALAKRGNKDQAVRAYEVLRSVYHLPGMTPDDYTQLASIYVVDACARHKLIDEALEIYEEAFNAGVMLDLPAFNALIKALVNAKKADQAADILKEVTVDNGIAPMEESYYPLLVSLAKLRDYDLATEMMEHGRSRGIIFSLEVSGTTMPTPRPLQRWVRVALRQHTAARTARSHALIMRTPPVATPGSATRWMSTAVDTAAIRKEDALVELLKQRLAARDARSALTCFQQFQSPPDTLLTQRLVILLAKRAQSIQEVHTAVEILHQLYRDMIRPDDYMQLASIYVVDACLRHRQLDPALERSVQIFENTLAAGVSLDLPAYEGLLRGMVDASRLDLAVQFSKKIASHAEVVVPEEETFLPLLLALKEHQTYTAMVDVIDHARAHDIDFTYDKTYSRLIDGLSVDEGENDPVDRLMHYVDEALMTENPLGLDLEDEEDDDEEQR